MGTKQTKGPLSSEGRDSPHRLMGSRRRSRSQEKPNVLSAKVLRASERLGRAEAPPYQRRVNMVQEMATLVSQGRQHQATQLLKSLRQDLGMESTSLDDVLYRYASFRNLVDPITHDLIISLARHIHCPRPEGNAVGAMEKVCRQLTYHLSPHSQCRRRRLGKGKPQHCLKAVLSETAGMEAVDLSGIFLGAGREVERLLTYLEGQGGHLASLELCFTEMTDQGFLQLLPSLGRLPRLNHLSLNGNRLTRAVLRPLTDLLKEPQAFPSLTWIDLGNNVDIFSLPQPFLVSLRKRCPKQGTLPTIPETGESQGGEREGQEGEREGENLGGERESQEGEREGENPGGERESQEGERESRGGEGDSQEGERESQGRERESQHGERESQGGERESRGGEKESSAGESESQSGGETEVGNEETKAIAASNQT